jgi:hypothetical protein
MQHSLSIRESKDSKKEVVVELNLPDKYSDAKVTESLVACAFRFIIIRATDTGRGVMKSADYKEKRLGDDDVKRKCLEKFNDMLTNQRYEFRTKGQALSKPEKINKDMADLSPEELAGIIAKAQELQKAKGA